MKMRRWMTEILLDVTNTEVEAVAAEVYRKSRQRKSQGIYHRCVHTAISTVYFSSEPLS